MSTSGLAAAFAQPGALALWSFLASVVMATCLEAARLSGLSRISLPLLFGTALTASRARAFGLGYVAYTLGGWAFGIIYALILASFSCQPVWTYALISTGIGIVHGVFLISVFLALLPEIHPRLTNSYDGPDLEPHVEPPGPFGLNYGWWTPVALVLAQIAYGLVFGIGMGAALSSACG
jgi:hypothetical protein